MLRTPTAPTQPDEADVGIAQGVPDHRNRSGGDDLGVLMDQHQRLEIVAPGEPVEQRVVGTKDGPAAGVASITESASAARLMPGSAHRAYTSGFVTEDANAIIVAAPTSVIAHA